MTDRPAVAALRAVLQRFLDWGDNTVTSAEYERRYGSNDSLEDLRALAAAALEAPSPTWLADTPEHRAANEASFKQSGLDWCAQQMAYNWPRNKFGSTLTQGEYDALLVRGEAPPEPHWEEIDEAALTVAERAYWKDDGVSRHNLAAAILTYLGAVRVGPLPPGPCQHVDAIERALNELGVPQPGYPQPVTNAVEILRASLGVRGVVPAPPPEPAASVLREWVDENLIPDSDEESGAPFWYCSYCDGPNGATKETIGHVPHCPIGAALAVLGVRAVPAPQEGPPEPPKWA